MNHSCRKTRSVVKPSRRWGRPKGKKTTILDNMSELIVYRNAAMETVWASKSAADWHGITPQEIVGRVCHRAHYGWNEPCDNCYVIDAMKSGIRRELDTQSPDGRHRHTKSRGRFPAMVESISFGSSGNRLREAYIQDYPACFYLPFCR
jgi:PAS domain-containing protein